MLLPTIWPWLRNSSIRCVNYELVGGGALSLFSLLTSSCARNIWYISNSWIRRGFDIASSINLYVVFSFFASDANSAYLIYGTFLLLKLDYLPIPRQMSVYVWPN